MSQASARAFVISVALAVLHTWPLASDLAGLSRHDNADTTLNTWAVSWVAHVVPRDPLRVFDAPIFHPDRRTLGYSEPLLVPGVLAIPLRAVGLDATVTYNLLVILGFALSAWAMWRVVAAWTGDEAAGAVAGLAYAFNAHLLTRFGHLQAIHAQALPLVLFALDRIATRPAVRDALWLGVGFALVGATSIYQLAFAAGAAVAGLLGRAGEWWRRPWPTIGVAAFGASVGVALLAPLLWQYLGVSRESGLSRTLGDAAVFAATWRDYLATGGRLHHAWWSAPFLGNSSALFPGVTVTLLAMVALVGPGTQRGRVHMMVAIGAAGVVMSLGPATGLYRWLFDHVPLLQATRATSRWGVLALTALAVLAGIGLAACKPRLSRRAYAVLAATALALVTIEALRAPMAFTPTPAIPAVYARLATLPNAVLLEFPTYGGQDVARNAPYLLAQTTHFKPIVAGYSGIFTPAFSARLADLNTFPSERARAVIDDIGVTHVVLHLAPLRSSVGQAAIDAASALPWVRQIYDDETTRVLELRRDVR